MSIGRILNAGYTVQFVGKSCGKRRRWSYYWAQTNSCDWQRDFGRTRVNIPVEAVRALIGAGSITVVRVINDFSPFICDSCEYVKTTRKRSEQHNWPKPFFPYGLLRPFAHS